MIDRTKLDNSFEFVVVAGARARQLLRGAVPRVPGDHKAIQTAQTEVLQDKVRKLPDGHDQ